MLFTSLDCMWGCWSRASLHWPKMCSKRLETKLECPQANRHQADPQIWGWLEHFPVPSERWTVRGRRAPIPIWSCRCSPPNLILRGPMAPREGYFVLLRCFCLHWRALGLPKNKCSKYFRRIKDFIGSFESHHCQLRMLNKFMVPFATFPSSTLRAAPISHHSLTSHFFQRQWVRGLIRPPFYPHGPQMVGPQTRRMVLPPRPLFPQPHSGSRHLCWHQYFLGYWHCIVKWSAQTLYFVSILFHMGN
jgi:hypothetical protein